MALKHYWKVFSSKNHGCHVARSGRNSAASGAYFPPDYSAALLFEERILQALRKDSARPVRCHRGRPHDGRTEPAASGCQNRAVREGIVPGQNRGLSVPGKIL